MAVIPFPNTQPARVRQDSDPATQAAWAAAKQSMQTLQDVLSDQRLRIEEFRDATERLGENMRMMKKNMQEYRENLASIPIGRLRAKTRRLISIMEAAEQGQSPIHELSERVGSPVRLR